MVSDDGELTSTVVEVTVMVVVDVKTIALFITER